jgi:hypothetical protein
MSQLSSTPKIHNAPRAFAYLVHKWGLILQVLMDSGHGCVLRLAEAQQQGRGGATPEGPLMDLLYQTRMMDAYGT